MGGGQLVGWLCNDPRVVNLKVTTLPCRTGTGRRRPPHHGGPRAISRWLMHCHSSATLISSGRPTWSGADDPAPHPRADTKRRRSGPREPELLRPLRSLRVCGRPWSRPGDARPGSRAHAGGGSSTWSARTPWKSSQARSGARTMDSRSGVPVEGHSFHVSLLLSVRIVRS